MFSVSFNWRISPRTSTVIFFDISPFATAIATSAIFRTCAVRLPAIWFTESVKIFPCTCHTRHVCLSTQVFLLYLPLSPHVLPPMRNHEAGPPSVLMVFLTRGSHAYTSTPIFLERSPFATAVVTSAILRTWLVRFDAILFTESVKSFHVPPTPGTVGLSTEFTFRTHLSCHTCYL